MKKFLFISMLCLTLIQPFFTNTVMANEIEQKIIEIENVKEARKDIIEMRFRTNTDILLVK